MSNKNYINIKKFTDNLCEYYNNPENLHKDYLIKNDNSDSSHTYEYKNIKYFEQNYVAKHILDITLNTLKNKVCKSQIENKKKEINGYTYIHPMIIRNSIFKTTKVLPLFFLEFIGRINSINFFGDGRKSKIIDNAISDGIYVPNNLEIYFIDYIDPLIKLSDEQKYLFTIYKLCKFLSIDNSKIKNNIEFQSIILRNKLIYDILIKNCRFVNEYDENGKHHTSKNGADNDWYKENCTNRDGYKYLSFKQITNTEILNDTEYRKSSIYFIINYFIPITIKRRLIFDFETKYDILIKDYCLQNGVEVMDKLLEIEKSDKILLDKALDTVKALNLDKKKILQTFLRLRSSRYSQKLDNYLIVKNSYIKNKNNEILFQIDEQSNKIIDNFDNESYNNFISNIILDSEGFKFFGSLIGTKYSEKVIDRFIQIEKCMKSMLLDIKSVIKELINDIDNSKLSYKNLKEDMMNKYNNLKNKYDTIYKNKNKVNEKEIKLLKNTIKNNSEIFKLIDNDAYKDNNDKISPKFKKLIKKWKENKINNDYDNKKIDFGERFFNHIPDLIYSEYADELISVKEIKYRYNYWIDENKLSLKKIKSDIEMKNMILLKMKNNNHINILYPSVSSYSHNMTQDDVISNLKIIDMSKEINKKEIISESDESDFEYSLDDNIVALEKDSDSDTDTISSDDSEESEESEDSEDSEEAEDPKESENNKEINKKLLQI